MCKNFGKNHFRWNYGVHDSIEIVLLHAAAALKKPAPALAPFNEQQTGISRYDFINRVGVWSLHDYVHQFQVYDTIFAVQWVHCRYYVALICDNYFSFAIIFSQAYKLNVKSNA